MNEIKIVVSGQNKFAATQAALVKQVQGVKTAADGATASAESLSKAVEKPKTAAVDKVTKSLDKAKTSAKAAAAELGKVAKVTGTAKISDAIDDASRSADVLVKRIENVTKVSDQVATRMPLRTVWRDAVRESSAAMDELVLTLYKAGSEAGAALYQGLRLDRVQARLRVIGGSVSAVLDRALEPARRARAALVSAADAIGDAWDDASGAIEAAVAAARRAAAATLAAAMVPIRRTKTLAVDTAASISAAVGRGVDRAKSKATSAADAVSAAWTRAADRVVARSRVMGAAVSVAFDRVLEPVVVVGERAVETAERVRAAWDRATAPVERFGRKLLDVGGTTLRLSGQVVAPFAKVGVAIGGVLGDAAQRGGALMVRHAKAALDKTLDDMVWWRASIVTAAKATWASVANAPGAALRAAQRTRNSIVSAVTEPFTAAVDKISGMLPAALSSPGLMGAVAAAALPLGSAAGGALVLGMGAGLAALGIMAAAQTGDVRLRWQQMGREVGRDWQEVTVPFRETTQNIIGDMEQAFSSLKPKLQRSFAVLAPAVTEFSDKLFYGLGRFDAFESLSRGAGAVMSDLGGRMPRIVDRLSGNFDNLAKSIERNPEALGQMVEALGAITGSVINDVSTLNAEWGGINEEIEMMGNFLRLGEYKLNVELGFTQDGQPIYRGKTNERIAELFRSITDAADENGRSMYTAATGAEQLETAWSKLSDAGDDFVKRGSAISDLLDLIAGRTPSWEDANQQMNDSIRELGERFGDVKNHIDGYGDALLNSNGTVNTTTANGSALYDTIQDLQDGFAGAAASVRDLESAGWSHDEAVQKVNADMRTQYDRLVASAGQMGLTEQQMRTLLAAYGLTPKFLDTIARLDENGIKAKLDWLAYTRTVIFRGVLDMSQLPSGATYKMGEYGGYAHGGISGGGWTTVGELGPERVKLPPGAQVMPYTESRRSLEQTGGAPGAGGTGTAVLEIRSGGSRMDDLLIQILQQAIRVRGGDVQVVLGGGR